MATRDGTGGGNGNLEFPSHGAARLPFAGSPDRKDGPPEYSRPKLRKVCSWCKKVEDPGDPGAETTHTLCEACQPGVFAEAGLTAPPAAKEERPLDAHALAHTMGERFLSEDCIAFARAFGVEPLPGGVL